MDHLAALPVDHPAGVVVVVGVAVVEVKFRDRVGLGWRPELAPHILSNLESIDALEIIADNYFSASKKSIQSLQFLARQIPISLHGVGMGLASSHPLEIRRAEKMASLVDKIQPEFWSEHLAFVRAGGFEIGHLAAPPRNQQTVDGTIHNITMAANIIGSLPHMENIATLIQPPGSSFTEPEWITQIIKKSNTPFLLDLHNLYANAKNFDHDPITLLQQLPFECVSTIHLSGGCWINEVDGIGQRLLDDHVHDVPTELFELLEWVAQNSTQNLTVIIERDGNFPIFSEMLAQMDLARAALRKGRLIAQTKGAYEYA